MKTTPFRSSKFSTNCWASRFIVKLSCCDESKICILIIEQVISKIEVASRDESGRAALAGALAPVDASIAKLGADIAALSKSMGENSSSIAMLDRQVAGMLSRSAADVIAAAPSTRPEPAVGGGVASPTAPPRPENAAADAEMVGR